MATNEAIHNAVDKAIEKIEARWPSVLAPDPQTWYAMKRDDAVDEAEVSIYDEIGAFGITAAQFVAELKQITAKRINLRLNTPGGEVFDATVIHNALAQHPAEVVIHVDGVAASAGSFIAMSADEVRMADNAYMMIHDARGGAYGGVDEMRTYAEVLEKMNDNIAGMYQKKAGKTRKHWRDLMSAETWFTAKEAKEEGLADSVYAAVKKDAPVKANFDFSIYNKIPAPVRCMWGLKSSPEQPEQAPEASPRGDAPPVSQKENSEMETSPQAPPAPTPAAGTGTIVQGTPATAIDAAEAHKRRIDELKGITAENLVENGRQQGVKEGAAAERARLTAILAVCPGRPDMAINAFFQNQAPESVKIAFDAVLDAEAKARKSAEQKDEEINRWKALAASGGITGGITMSVSADGQTEVPTLDPKAQAEMEWDGQPQLRKGFSNKTNYVNFRKMELEGRFVNVTPARS